MADWDITLDGQGYMLVPGSYRSTAGSARPRSRSQEVRLDDFRGGLTAGRLALSSTGAWPASWPEGSRAVGPAPARQTASGTLSTARPVLAVSSRDALYLAAGDTLYRWDGSGAVVARWTMPAAATSIARVGDLIYIAFGLAADVASWNDLAGIATGSVLGVGYRADLLGATGEMLVSAPNATPSKVDIWNQDLTSSTSAWLDGPVRSLASGGSGLLIATDGALYAVEGAQYLTHRLEHFGALGEPQGAGWLAIYRGELIAWLAGQVARYEVSRERWVPLGLAGESSSGAATVAGWLVVAVQLPGATGEELWAFDGEGWWRLDVAGGYPAAGPDGRLASFQPGSSALSYHDLTAVDVPAALGTRFSVATRPLASDRGEAQRWISAGVELAREDGLPIGSWQATLEASVDGGASWELVSTSAATGPRMTISGPLEVEAGALQLRLTLDGMGGLPPFIQSLWAEHVPAGRRRWSFEVLARDDLINRAGLLDPRDGQTIRSALWAVREAGQPVSFQDVDHGATAVERQVRLVELAEAWPKPFDQPALGAQARLALALEEV